MISLVSVNVKLVTGDMTMAERDDGLNRRKVLECMTWAGTGVLWTVAGGVPTLTRHYRRSDGRAAEGFYLSANQRQSYGLRQAGQSQCQRDAAKKRLRGCGRCR